MGRPAVKRAPGAVPLRLAPGERTDAQAVYAPRTRGRALGTVVLAGNVNRDSAAFNPSASAIAVGRLALTPGSVVFGTVPVGRTLTQPATVSNLGKGPITITSAAVHGRSFALRGLNLPLVLKAGQSAPLGISFTPAATGANTGTISLVGRVLVDRPIRSRHRQELTDIALTTVSTTLRAGVSGTGTALGQLMVSPASLTVGKVKLGSSRTVSARLTNTGGSNLTVGDASVTGGGFALTSPSLPITLAPGTSSALSVSFSANLRGTSTGTVSLSSTAANSAVEVPVSGSVVEPGVLTCNPASLTFDNVPAGNTQSLPVTLSNSGGSDVTLSRAKMFGSNFDISGLAVPLTLSAGQSTSFNITFAARSGSKSGKLVISSDASNSTLTLPLSGSTAAALPGSLISVPGNLSFRNVTVGKTQTQIATVSNSGSGPVTLSQARVSGAGFGVNGLNLPLSLDAGASTSFNVNYSPKSAGSTSGTLTVASDASNSTLTVALAATAVAPVLPGALTPSPASLSFSSVQVGQTQTLPATLTNTGGSSLTISQATVSGAFSASGLSLPTTLNAGQSATLSVTFAPQASGSASGSLVVVSDASNGTLTVPLAGATTSPAPSQVTAGVLTPSPSSLSFGSVQVGGSKTLSATLTNTGGSSVNLTQAAASGGFTVSGLNLPATLDAGQSASLSVTFAPQSSGSASSSLVISSDASNGTLAIPLAATATAAAAPGTLTASPASFSFGSVQIGADKTLSATLTNSGSSSVSVTQATVSGSGFTVSGFTLPLTLAAGQSAAFSVDFSPKSSGAASGSLAITSDASNPSFSIPLSASGATAGLLSASDSTLSFGSVAVGDSATQSETLTNTGGSDLTITQANVTGPGFSISGLQLPLTLIPGQSFTFGAAFAPTSGGSKTGSISVTSDASNATLTISLDGTATVAGQLGVSPASLSFGNVTVGSAKSLQATLTASGSSISISSANLSTSEFTLSGLSLPVTLKAGQKASFTITFAPQFSGTASASATFSSNASNPSLVQTLSGSGVAAPQHTVSLTWNASASGVVGYNVYRGTTSGGPYAQVTAMNADTSYVDNTVQSGQTYFYVTTAVDVSGRESVYSNQTQAVIPTP